jgi:acetoacetyl-CoA synthetase
MTKFLDFVNGRYNKNFAGYFDLYGRSVDNIPDFWAAVWEFVGIKASEQYDTVVDDLAVFPGAKWFDGAELNFAENLLRFRDDRTAIVYRCETRPAVRLSYREFYGAVSRLAVP